MWRDLRVPTPLYQTSVSKGILICSMDAKERHNDTLSFSATPLPGIFDAGGWVSKPRSFPAGCPFMRICACAKIRPKVHHAWILWVQPTWKLVHLLYQILYWVAHVVACCFYGNTEFPVIRMLDMNIVLWGWFFLGDTSYCAVQTREKTENQVSTSWKWMGMRGHDADNPLIFFFQILDFLLPPPPLPPS